MSEVSIAADDATYNQYLPVLGNQHTPPQSIVIQANQQGTENI